MPVLKLPDSFGCNSHDTVRVHRGLDVNQSDDTVILQVEGVGGFAEVEMKLEETTDLIAMLQEVIRYRMEK